MFWGIKDVFKGYKILRKCSLKCVILTVFRVYSPFQLYRRIVLSVHIQRHDIAHHAGHFNTRVLISYNTTVFITRSRSREIQFKFSISLWNSAGVSAALLPRRLPNFWAIDKLITNLVCSRFHDILWWIVLLGQKRSIFRSYHRDHLWHRHLAIAVAIIVIRAPASRPDGDRPTTGNNRKSATFYRHESLTPQESEFLYFQYIFILIHWGLLTEMCTMRLHV